jgi:hypothetical protein
MGKTFEKLDEEYMMILRLPKIDPTEDNSFNRMQLRIFRRSLAR